MEAPISASLGAMVSVLGKLDEILATEHKDEIWKLREDLAITRTLLLKLSKARDPPVTARYWMKDVRELSYDMEDCVDAETDWVDEKMSGFKTRVEEANERYHRYMLGDSVPSCADISVDHRLPTVDGRRAVVGLHAKGGPIDRLCQSLSDQDPELKVVPIVGVAGIGKTTLAEQLWHELGAFQCRAFVQTSKKPDMRGILRSILSQVRPHQPLPGVSDVHRITQDIHDHLRDKSYFVIIDDLWATSVWEVVSRAFPEGKHRSRIITTTENEDVALACCGYQSSYIFHMEPLSVQHSEEMFTSALFGSGAEQLDECSHEIMRRCGGLPQAIVIIASILASNRETETIENTEKAGEKWNYLQKLVLNDLAEDTPFEEILTQVLNLCYSSLHSCLQTCLLYLSVYSENYIFFKEDLSKQWIVEGFIRGSTQKETMQVSQSYFDKLVSMGLIRHIDVKNSDEVVSYAVQHMVHDFITYKSIEENFVTVMDYSESTMQLSDKVRRLSLQFGSAAYATTPASTRLSQVRSLTFIGLVKCMPSVSEFKLLRVLILNLWGDPGSTSFDLTGISELLLLRYLQIICNVIVQLPDQMKGLEHLETLEINARPDWSLLHLHLEGGANLSDVTLYPSASSMSISSSEPCYHFDPVKTFELFPPICSIPKWIGQFKKLCTLKIVVRELLKDFISSLGGLPALTVLSLYVRRHTAETIIFNTSQFAAVEYFEFKCGVLSLNFQEGAMPSLQMLKLGFNAHKGEQYGHILAGIEHLSNLKEVVGIIGRAGGAEEPDWRAAESAFKAAIHRYPMLASEVNVRRTGWIEEEYGFPENQHFSTEKHPPSKQPGKMKEVSDRDIEQNTNTESSSALSFVLHADMKKKESISRQEAKHERVNDDVLVRNENEHKSRSALSMVPKRPWSLIASEPDGRVPRGKFLRVAAAQGIEPWPVKRRRIRLRALVFAVLFIIRVSKHVSYEPYNIVQIRRVVREEVRRELGLFCSLILRKLESLDRRIDVICKDQAICSQRNNYLWLRHLKEIKEEEKANAEGLVRNEHGRKRTGARTRPMARKAPDDLFMDAGQSYSGAPAGNCLPLPGPHSLSPGKRLLRKIVFVVLFIIRVTRVRKGTSRTYDPYNLFTLGQHDDWIGEPSLEELLRN